MLSAIGNTSLSSSEYTHKHKPRAQQESSGSFCGKNWL